MREVSYVSFRELFRPEGAAVRLHRIPEFQRGYDWDDQQVQELLVDLDRLAAAGLGRGGESHFCGTVILLKGEHQRLVVDGQQRLSTLVLVHRCLAGNADFWFASGDPVFQPQEMDAGMFERLLRQGRQATSEKSIAQRKYNAAFKEASEWAGRKSAEERHDMLQIVESGLSFITFVLADGGDVSCVFESINNRGKPLNQLDLVKNHLMYVERLNDWRSCVDSRWKEINGSMAEIDEIRNAADRVLRSVLVALFGRSKKGEHNAAIDIVKKRIPVDCDRAEFNRFLDFLVQAFDRYRSLRQSHKTDPSCAVQTQLTYLNHQPTLRSVLPLLLVDRVSGPAGAQVLTALEKMNFRLLVLVGGAKRVDSFERTLHELAHNYQQRCVDAADEATKQRAADEVVATVERLVRKAHPDGVAQIVEALTLDDTESFDYAHWTGRRYFLARWEESLGKNQSFDFGLLKERSDRSNDYLSLEHIFALRGEGNVGKYLDRLVLRRLGNFMLLPLGVNISLSNGSIDSKLDKLEEEGRRVKLLSQNRQLKDVHTAALAFVDQLERRCEPLFGTTGKQNAGVVKRERNRALAIAKTVCDLREEAMIRFALKAWLFDGEDDASGSSSRFEGLFSYAHGSDCYRYRSENPRTKRSVNYLLGGREEDSADKIWDKRMRQLRRRREITEGSSDSLRKAA